MATLDENWDVSKFKTADLSINVTKIHLVAYPSDGNRVKNDSSSNNHWIIFLEKRKGPTGNAKSVRVDMTPGRKNDKLQGTIDLSSKPFNCTNNKVKKRTFRTRGRVTVEMITSLLSRNGRQRYRFTKEVEGCRYWNYVCLSDLEKAGYISKGSAKEALDDALSYYWASPNGKIIRAWKEGTFRT